MTSWSHTSKFTSSILRQMKWRQVAKSEVFPLRPNSKCQYGARSNFLILLAPSSSFELTFLVLMVSQCHLQHYLLKYLNHLHFPSFILHCCSLPVCSWRPQLCQWCPSSSHSVFCSTRVRNQQIATNPGLYTYCWSRLSILPTCMLTASWSYRIGNLASCFLWWASLGIGTY